MSKFVKSAAFPILIVVLLVFVAQRLVVSESSAAPSPTFSQLLVEIPAGRIASVTMKVGEQELVVVTKSGEKYTTGYPDDYADTLTRQLETADVPLTVEGIPSSPWWSSLIWLAPFILFIGFWIFLMNRMPVSYTHLTLPTTPYV